MQFGVGQSSRLVANAWALGSNGNENPSGKLWQGNMADTSVVTLPEIEEFTEVVRKRQPLYHVILLDDNDHTYAYVIEMLRKLFGYTEEKAYQLACEVDVSGKVILLTTTREHAELKQEQIHSYGADPHIERCKGSMYALIEPALA